MNHDSDSTLQDARGDIGAQRLARVYATALLDAAAKQGLEATAVIAELDSLLDDVLQHHQQLGVLFTGAAVGRNVRREAILKALTGRASDVLLRFLLVLNDHERLPLLRPIRAATHALEDERHKRYPVHVWSAVPLTDEQKARLAEGVRQRFRVEPILRTHVDPSLLGGLKLRIGDQQLDDTVRRRLDDILTQILAKGSYEIQSGRDRFRTQ